MKIGFIDFFIDEWHANNYPGMIDEYNKAHGTDHKVAYAWAETEPAGHLSTTEWCEKFGVKKCETIEELCEKADQVIVLAPSDPDKHLGYAEKVFATGTSPYIDKTFAPDCPTAKRIFDLADKHNVKFFSSSALRYADELAGFNGDARAISFTGGGSNIAEYIIHQIEMAVKCLGIGAENVVCESIADEVCARVCCKDGKRASFLYAPDMPFTAIVADRDGNSSYRAINSQYFVNLIADIFRFFETGETSFATEETLEVMRIRDAVLAAKDHPGETVRIS